MAAYVASVAGKPGQDQGLLAAVGGNQNANKTAVAKGGTLTIPADPTGALAFQFGKATAKRRPGDDLDAEPGRRSSTTSRSRAR